MTQELAFEQINETDGSTLAHLDITTLQQELQTRYGLDLYSAFPQAPLTNQWPLEAVQTLVQSARLRLSHAAVGNIPMETVDKHVADLTPSEQNAANKYGRLDYPGSDGQAWVTFQMPKQEQVDPIYGQLQQELDAVSQFVQNGAASHDLLRNLATSGEQLEPAPEAVG